MQIDSRCEHAMRNTGNLLPGPLGVHKASFKRSVAFECGDCCSVHIPWHYTWEQATFSGQYIGCLMEG